MVYIHCLTHILQLEKSSSREETHTKWSFYHQSPKKAHYNNVSRHKDQRKNPQRSKVQGTLYIYHQHEYIRGNMGKKDEHDSGNPPMNVT